MNAQAWSRDADTPLFQGLQSNINKAFQQNDSAL